MDPHGADVDFVAQHEVDQHFTIDQDNFGGQPAGDEFLGTGDMRKAFVSKGDAGGKGALRREDIFASTQRARAKG